MSRERVAARAAAKLLMNPEIIERLLQRLAEVKA